MSNFYSQNCSTEGDPSLHFILIFFVYIHNQNQGPEHMRNFFTVICVPRRVPELKSWT